MTQLDRLLQVVKAPADRAELVAAYLRDMIPPSAAHLVEVGLNVKGRAIQPAKEDVELPDKTEEAFAFLRSLCVDNADIRKMIETTAAAMMGR